MSSAVELIGPDQAPILARPFYGTAPSPITASLAHVPELLEVALPFIAKVLGSSAIGAREKEIVIVRTSTLLGCGYCMQTHTAVALDVGLGHDEVLALRREVPLESACFDERELALIAWTDAVAASGAVSERERARAAIHFADPELVELTLVIAATTMLNRYCTALGLPTSEATRERLAAEGLA